MLSSICSPDLFNGCAIFRIKRVEEHFFTRQPNVSAVRLFSAVFFFNVVPVISFVQKTLEKRLSSCQNVWLCYCTEINFEHKTTYLWSMRSPGGGELSLSACPEVGNRPPSKKKIANPRGCARGGMVTGRIEPCITLWNVHRMAPLCASGTKAWLSPCSFVNVMNQ